MLHLLLFTIFVTAFNFKIMKELSIETRIKVYSLEELCEKDRELVSEAIAATHRSYAPYSKFTVGASARLANGSIVTGSNQENAAYPSGLCAERTTLFYANSQYPDQAVTALAIASRHMDEASIREHVCPPCGACRQVMLETENRFGCPMKILLCGSNQVYVIESASCLLPLSFGSELLK